MNSTVDGKRVLSRDAGTGVDWSVRVSDSTL